MSKSKKLPPGHYVVTPDPEGTEALEEAWGAVCALLDAGLEAEAIAEARRLAALDPVFVGPLPAYWPRRRLSGSEWDSVAMKERPRMAHALDRLAALLAALTPR